MGGEGLRFDQIEVGMSESVSKTITDADIVLFAGISGDFNPIHIDEEYAKGTLWGGRIAHGGIAVALISAVLGTKLPGPGSIYISQNLRFLAPIRVGDTVCATVSVSSKDSQKKRVVLATRCAVGDVVVAEGESTLKLPG